METTPQWACQCERRAILAIRSNAASVSKTAGFCTLVYASATRPAAVALDSDPTCGGAKLSAVSRGFECRLPSSLVVEFVDAEKVRFLPFL